VYTYIEKILSKFRGDVLLNVEIDRILRTPDAVKIIVHSTGEQEFDRVVFATPPDRVMALLADPTAAEIKRFSAWKANYVTSIVHNDDAAIATASTHHQNLISSRHRLNGDITDISISLATSHRPHTISYRIN
jgi:predicted NAD/FAD-binding protein